MYKGAVIFVAVLVVGYGAGVVGTAEAACRQITAAEKVLLQARNITLPSNGMVCDTDRSILAILGEGATDPYQFLLQRLQGKPASHVKGLNPEFAKRLAAFIQAAEGNGHSIKIFSGYRSVEHQRRLWQNALKKYGSASAARRWVAPPGGSNHNKGIAADLKYNGASPRTQAQCQANTACKWAHANAGSAQLRFRLSHEPWHIEPSGSVSGQLDGPSTHTSPTNDATRFLQGALGLGNPTGPPGSPGNPGGLAGLLKSLGLGQQQPQAPSGSSGSGRNERERAPTPPQTPINSTSQDILNRALEEERKRQEQEERENQQDTATSTTRIPSIELTVPGRSSTTTATTTADTLAALRALAETIRTDEEGDTQEERPRFINVPLPQAENVRWLIEQEFDLQIQETTVEDNNTISFEVRPTPRNTDGVSGFVQYDIDAEDTFSNGAASDSRIARFCQRQPWLTSRVSSSIIAPVFDAACERFGYEIPDHVHE